MKYFHEIPNEEWDSMVKEHKTWEDVKATHKQPDWCNYPEALDGIMGCWSLTERFVKSEEFCKTCPEHCAQ